MTLSKDAICQGEEMALRVEGDGKGMKGKTVEVGGGFGEGKGFQPPLLKGEQLESDYTFS